MTITHRLRFLRISFRPKKEEIIDEYRKLHHEGTHNNEYSYGEHAKENEREGTCRI
jgi:hypothetical protein